MRKFDPYHLLVSTYTEQNPHRLEAFFDAVFAIVMTILVLGLNLPDNSQFLSPGEILEEMLPQFIHFALAFFILAAFWSAHHRLFVLVKKVDNILIRLTFILLFITCLLPFTSSLAGDNYTQESALLLFHLNMFFLGLLFLSQWIYINKARLSVPVTQTLYRFIFFKSCIFPLVSLIAIGVLFFSPSWSSASYLLIFAFEALILLFKPTDLQTDANGLPSKINSISLMIGIHPDIDAVLHQVSEEMEISKEKLVEKILLRWSSENRVNTGKETQLCNLKVQELNKIG